MLGQYIKNKSSNLLIIQLGLLISGMVLLLSGTDYNRVILALLVSEFIYGFFGFYKYNQYLREQRQIELVKRELDKHYLSHELLKKPMNIEAVGYYDLMLLADRDMCNEIARSNQQMKEYREFIEEWIHEMKTPLTSLELLYGEGQDKDADYEMERLKNTLDKCLNFIRMDTLEKDYHVESVLICDILHELIMEEKTAIRGKGLVPVVEIREDSRVLCDAKWIKFVMKQLLNNAVKYSYQEGEITFFERYENDVVWIGIKDEGCGIEAADLPRIFERGFTGSSTKRDSASGIGLYLVKTCVDKMNLEIRVISQTEDEHVNSGKRGSIFEISFQRTV